MVAVASLNHLVPVAFAIIAALQIAPFYVAVSPYLQTLLSSSCSVFIGCVWSVTQKKPEAMSSKDAYMFPIIGSGVLFSLYILVKFISKEYLNALLGLYFFIIGIAVTHGTLYPLLNPFLPKSLSTHTPYDLSFQIPFKAGPDGRVELKLTQSDILIGSIGAILGAAYITTKNWVLNNIFGVMFAVQGIEYLSLGTIKIGIILLCALFFYDIFWVFGTEVMVTVAKGIEGPIKLLFPKDQIVPGVKTEFSMIGLGDLVIPGIYVAFLLRFDNKRFNGNTRYFPYCFGGYVLGLVATIVVMHVFKAAQPALLYLVPACLATSLIPAYLRKETEPLFAYNEEEKKEEEKEKSN